MGVSAQAADARSASEFQKQRYEALLEQEKEVRLMYEESKTHIIQKL